MKKHLFHSPIFFVLVLCLFGCVKKDDTGDTDATNVTALRKAGYDALEKAKQFNAENKSDSAFAYFLDAKNAFAASNENVYATYASLKMGEILNTYNDYNELQAVAVDALKYSNKAKSATYLPSIYIDLGISFAMMGDLSSAEENYLKGKKASTTPWDKANFDNNIAYANIVAENYPKAFSVLSDVKSNYKLADSIPIKATILDNYGYVAFKLGKAVDGNPMEKALQMRLKNNDVNGIIASYIHLAETELAKNPKESIKKALLAERLAYKNNSVSDRIQAMSFIIKHANPDLSKRFAIKTLRVSDSFSTANRKARNAFALIKYNYQQEHENTMNAKRDAEIEKSQKESERYQKYMMIALASLLGLLILWLIAHFIKRAKRIKEESTRKASYETEVRISTKLHDELANEVHKTIVFAETQKLDAPENKEALLTRLETIYEGTRNISRDNSDVPEDADFGTLVSDLLSEYRTEDCTVIAQGIAKVNWEHLPHFKRIAFYRILQEILANMHKHSKCSRAFFSFAQTGKNLVFNYSDDGVGQDAENATRKNGLRIMENRILELKGTFTFESKPGNGFRAHVEFPM